MVHLQLRSAFAAFKNRVKESARLIVKANRFTKEIDPYMVVKLWFTSIYTGLAPLGTFALVGFTAQQAISSYTSKKGVSQNLVVEIIIGYAIYKIFSTVFEELGRWRSYRFNKKVERLFDLKRVQKTISLDFARLNDPEFVRQSDLARNKERAIVSLFNFQGSLISTVVAVIASFSVVFMLGPLMTIAGILPVLPETIKNIFYRNKTRERWDNLHERRREFSIYLRLLNDADWSLQMKLARYIPFLYKKYISKTEEDIREEVSLWKSEARIDFLLSVLRNGLIILVLIYLSHLIIEGKSSFKDLLILTGMVTMLGNAFSGLANTFVNLREHSKDYAMFEELMNVQPFIDETSCTDFIGTQTPAIQLQNVSFSYPRKDEVVLQNISFTISPGKKVAIVGRNGAGKTTVLKLLSKGYLPTEGTVFIDDMNIASIKQESWWNKMTYLTQDNKVPDLTVIEALTGEENPDMERLITATKMIDAHNFILKKRYGYETRIGSNWENGDEFSGGEFQRLKIATIFYRLLKSDVHIGLFDEPMNNCDWQTKEAFHKTLKSMSDKTIIVVAHDNDYLHYFDKLIEIEDGKITRDIDDKSEIIAYQKMISDLKQNSIEEEA